MLIGYDNRADDSGVTITHSTEGGDNVAENAQAVQPSEFFRTTVLDPGWIKFAWTSFVECRLVAAIGCKVSAWANRCIHGNALGNAAWTLTNIDTFAEFGGEAYGDEFGKASMWFASEETANGEHYVELALTDLLDDAEEHGTIVSLVMLHPAGAGEIGKVRVQHVGDNSGTDYVDFDFDAETTSESGDISASEITDISADGDGTLYRVTFLADTVLDTSRTIRIQALDSGGGTSYVGTNRLLYVSQVQVAPNWTSVPRTAAQETTTANVPRFYSTAAIPGAAVRVLRSTTGDEVRDQFQSFARGNDWEFATASFADLATVPWRSANVEIEIHDESNADSQVDVGRVYIGPAWEPALQSAARLEWRHVRNRRLADLTINYTTEAEAYGQAMALARILDIGHAEQQMEAMEGQTYRPRQKPALFILDPTESVYGQEQMVYGWVNESRVQWAGPGTINGTEHTELYRVVIELEEVIA